MTERRSNINLKQLATTETKLMESQEKKKTCKNWNTQGQPKNILEHISFLNIKCQQRN